MLAPHLQEVILFAGDVLHRPGDLIEQVYFLYSGIVSLTAILEAGKTVETASMGKEGAVGTIEGFGALRAFTSAVMAHVQQTTACNTLHNLTSRLSRILLLAADRCGRAVIQILDRKKLEASVCECYSTIRRTIDLGFGSRDELRHHSDTC